MKNIINYNFSDNEIAAMYSALMLQIADCKLDLSNPSLPMEDKVLAANTLKCSESAAKPIKAYLKSIDRDPDRFLN